ncbi:MAG: tryptophan--tRNA ligase [Candidatus Saccharibacteria bacterium]|nr:tryptophan--tRNA ligase [Candidatus Saccharibacteria bacterium]
MKTILTGVRVNSDLHLGHFLGVILPLTRLANKHSKDYNVNIFIPDLHTIISEIDGTIKENTLLSIKYYLAAGLELNNNIHFYRQSYIPAHSEMTWLLNCIATVGELKRMTQYKDKSAGKDSVNAGIFDYPVLMVSDILLYDATYVPVGEDQFQHLELARNLALRVNHKFNQDIFTVPANTSDQMKFMGNTDGVRIRSLTNPEKKMSKSDPADNSKILLSESPKAAQKKIMSATTDSLGEINFDFKTQPGISNLLQINALLEDKPLDEMIKTWQGNTRYGDLKKSVAKNVQDILADFQAKVTSIPDETVLELLKSGESYARPLAETKLLRLQSAFGLR